MSDSKRPPSRSRRMPKDSLWYDKGVPILLGVLGLITLILIVLAAGILFGVIVWR